MSDIPPSKSSVPELPYELMFKIFLCCDAKTLVRVQATSHLWKDTLNSYEFVSEIAVMWRNKGCSLFGHFETGQRFPSVLPFVVANEGWFDIVGIDNGVFCFRLSKTGDVSNLVIWNPLSRRQCVLDDPITGIADESTFLFSFLYYPRTINYSIMAIFLDRDDCKMPLRFTGMERDTRRSLVWNAITGAIRTIPGPPSDGFPILLPTLSFVHIPSTSHYCIVHTYRKRHNDDFLMYQMSSSQLHRWSRTRGCLGKIHRLGPNSVVLDGVVYWINHSHEETHSPESIISFSVVKRIFNIFNIPPDLHPTCHSLIAYEGRIAVVYVQDEANNQIMSIVSLRQRSNDRQSWRIEMKIKNVHAPERPHFFEGGNLISVTDDMHPGALGVDGIVVSRFRQDQEFARARKSKQNMQTILLLECFQFSFSNFLVSATPLVAFFEV
ncbi:hypothetical protein PIB30_028676 [Stylosanthes scabra]|uniref:F-box domain-containing protein n=1 Tax=Stylosanthes scabra TaxID=79078 RepID=A0ABU6SAL1_9FABA|nr:hypothetical protein [Stylosanthes scabra]